MADVTVSEDKLYRALAEQELRILAGFDKKLEAKLEPLDVRVKTLELENAGDARIEERARMKEMGKPAIIATLISAFIAIVSNRLHLN